MQFFHRPVLVEVILAEYYNSIPRPMQSLLDNLVDAVAGVELAAGIPDRQPRVFKASGEVIRYCQLVFYSMRDEGIVFVFSGHGRNFRISQFEGTFANRVSRGPKPVSESYLTSFRRASNSLCESSFICTRCLPRWITRPSINVIFFKFTTEDRCTRMKSLWFNCW